MNLKLHFLKSHLQYFPDNLEDYKKQGENSTKILSQIPKEMERRYQGRDMIAYFCWMLKREHVMKGVKEIRYIGRSKIKRFAKARDLKEKPKHTLPEKILHL